MLPVRRTLPHTTPDWISDDSLFFITINCEKREENQLCLPEIAKKIQEATEHYQTHQKWHCSLLLLMPDHLHGIFSFATEKGMQSTITNWKRYLARTAKIQWQRDFFDHRLRDHHAFTEKAHYILMNPVRKGLCEKPEDWPYTWSNFGAPR